MKASYTTVDTDYLDRRRLRPHARALHLCAMGVGAVISGDFFGWNYGLAAGGFGGLLISLMVMTAMYTGLCFSIAEMSPALPHAGGAYSFARTAMGPWAGYLTGLAENMEYILTPAVIVIGIGGYLSAVFGTSHAWEPLWWLLCYTVFVGLNVWGVEMSFHVSIVVTLVALAVLAVFWTGAMPHLDIARWARPYFPTGVGKAHSALVQLPFALWLYLGIEQLPLAAEESHDPQRDMPRGILYGLLTLIVVSFLTVVLRAPDLLAFASWILPDVAVGHSWCAPDAAPRASGGFGVGVCGRAHHPFDASGQQGRRRLTEHGRVGSGASLRFPDGLVDCASREICDHSPALRESAGHWRRCGSRGHRNHHSGDAVSEPRLQQGCHWRSGLVSSRSRVLRRTFAASPGAGPRRASGYGTPR